MENSQAVLDPVVSEGPFEVRRPLVIQGGVFPEPLYLAKDEEDAAKFIKRFCDIKRSEGFTVTVHNSLRVEYKRGQSWERVEVTSVLCWQ